MVPSHSEGFHFRIWAAAVRKVAPTQRHFKDSRLTFPDSAASGAEPDPLVKWSGGSSATAVAAAESSGGRSGSQAPDPWASSSSLVACVGARPPRGPREGLGEATGRSPGPLRSLWRAKAPAQELRGIVRCGACEDQQQQQPYPRVHTRGDGDRVCHKSILDVGNQFCSLFMTYDQSWRTFCLLFASVRSQRPSSRWRSSWNRRWLGEMSTKRC